MGSAASIGGEQADDLSTDGIVKAVEGIALGLQNTAAAVRDNAHSPGSLATMAQKDMGGLLDNIGADEPLLRKVLTVLFLELIPEVKAPKASHDNMRMPKGPMRDFKPLGAYPAVHEITHHAQLAPAEATIEKDPNNEPALKVLRELVPNIMNIVRDTAVRIGQDQENAFVSSLCAVVAQGNELFVGVYKEVWRMIQSGEAEDCARVKRAVQLLLDRKFCTDATNADDPVVLLQHAAVAKPKYDMIVEQLASGLSGVTLKIAPKLKKLSRIIEKSVLETKNLGKSRRIFDVVRGMFVCDSLATVASVLQRIADCSDIVPVRIKERFFKQPSPGGWRDVMVCFFVKTDPNKHVCELQLAHSQMLTARKGLPGHAVYNRVRNASELLDVSFESGREFFGKAWRGNISGVADFKVADLIARGVCPKTSAVALDDFIQAGARATMLRAGGFSNEELVQFLERGAGFKADKGVILAAVTQDGISLRQASAELKADRTVVLAAVTQNGLALEHAAADAKADNEILQVAVRQNGLALAHASAEVRAAGEVVLSAVSQCGSALKLASVALRADRGVVLAAVSQDGLSIEHASAELRADGPTAMTAVKTNGLALRYLSAELKADKTVVMVAVQQNGLALEHASLKLKDNKEVVLVAVAQNGLALEHASDTLRAAKDVVVAAMAQNGASVLHSKVPEDKLPYNAADLMRFAPQLHAEEDDFGPHFPDGFQGAEEHDWNVNASARLDLALHSDDAVSALQAEQVTPLTCPLVEILDFSGDTTDEDVPLLGKNRCILNRAIELNLPCVDRLVEWALEIVNTRRAAQK